MNGTIVRRSSLRTVDFTQQIHKTQVEQMKLSSSWLDNHYSVMKVKRLLIHSFIHRGIHKLA